MPRIPRRYLPGEYHHVINRANVKSRIFAGADDYRVFIRLLASAVDRYDIGLLGYCVMPSHWHLVIRPGSQRDMSRALHWLTSMHAHRWAREHEREGLGHVYQGRFFSVPVQAGTNLWRVLRYVERNALAAGLAPRAEAWPWGSACQREAGLQVPALMPQGFLPPAEWIVHLNLPAGDPAIGEAIRNNRPIGDADWVAQRYQALGIRPPGRPGRRPKGSQALTKNEKSVPVT